MQNYLPLTFVLFTVACSEPSEPQKKSNAEPLAQKSIEVESVEPIIAERIDGPANIRDQPNGEVLFSLNDNALIQASKIKDDWYEIEVYLDIEYDAYPIDYVRSGEFLISENDTLGKVLKSHMVGSGQGGDFAFMTLSGFTHKNNIKSQTIIENHLEQYIRRHDRKEESWKHFIDLFELKKTAFHFNGFRTYYNYESSIPDPSPGFRVVLLFINGELVGILHSRKMDLKDMETTPLEFNYLVSFIKDFPKEEKNAFIRYMNEWIKGVD